MRHSNDIFQDDMSPAGIWHPSVGLGPTGCYGLPCLKLKLEDALLLMGRGFRHHRRVPPAWQSRTFAHHLSSDNKMKQENWVNFLKQLFLPYFWAAIFGHERVLAISYHFFHHLHWSVFSFQVTCTYVYSWSNWIVRLFTCAS